MLLHVLQSQSFAILQNPILHNQPSSVGRLFPSKQLRIRKLRNEREHGATVDETGLFRGPNQQTSDN